MKNKICFIILLLITLSISYSQENRIVEYDLFVKDTLVNFAGEEKRAIAVNGQIPMPSLTFTEGDSAIIRVHNLIDESTSFHWHGLLVPNEQDGVPYLTTAPIEPNTVHTFTFRLRQSGTYWYHSHSGLQEQIGMYGSLTINKKKDDPTFRIYDEIPSFNVLLSDWTNMNPNTVHRYLHNANDWFAIEKGTVQSYGEALVEGHFGTKLENEWKRMLAMDVSDVYYEKFLINGKNENTITELNNSNLKAGDKIRLRVANGSASTYFWLNYSGGKITVIASDGVDVEPVEVDRLIIGVSETYDVVITIPEDQKQYQFMATSEDRIGSAILNFGEGELVPQPPLPRLKYFEGMKMMNNMMNMDGTMDDMGMNMGLQKMDMNSVMYPEIKKKSKKMNMNSKEMDHSNHNKANDKSIVTLNYKMLKSPTKTVYPKDSKVKTLEFELTGNMNRYVWSLDNKTLSETDKILIKAGEVVRIILYNNSMMRHPMHLHGHFFRVINGQGDYAPLKNVLDIMPMERDTIEFLASEEYGDWFFHCHILYHMMSGMGRVFSYENSPPNPQLPDKEAAYDKVRSDDQEFHFMAENDFASNGNDGMLMIQNTRWSFTSEWRLGYNDHHGYELETHFGRYIGQMQWFMPFVGIDVRYRKMEGETEENIFGQKSTKDKRAVFSLGAEYTLPMLLILQGEVFHDGKVRFQLMREDIPLTARLRMAFMLNTDREYMGGLKYIITRNVALATHYDSDMKFGVGLTISY